MIGDIAKKVEVESAKNMSKNESFVRAYFSINADPLPPDRTIVSLAFQSDIFQTNMSYSIQYKKIVAKKTLKFETKYPFLIKADFLPKQRKTSSRTGLLRVASYQDLLERAKTDKYIQWLIDWTVLSQTIFDAVQDCPGLLFYFSVNIDAYVLNLRAKGCTEPINKMFIAPEIPDIIEEKQKERFKQYRQNLGYKNI